MDGGGGRGVGGGGDVHGPDGYSVYPGNTNGIFLRLSTYLDTLAATDGLVNEFVNPKYVEEGDAGGVGGGRAFKSPTRLECLLQDIAWSLPAEATCALVSYPPAYGYFPCKNDLATAAKLSAVRTPRATRIEPSDFGHTALPAARMRARGACCVRIAVCLTAALRAFFCM